MNYDKLVHMELKINVLDSVLAIIISLSYKAIVDLI
jgi:hypothetical protein